MSEKPATPNLSLPNLSLQITVVFSVLTVVTYLVAPNLDLIYAIVSAVLFFGGAVILGLGFWNGIQRSKVDDVRLTGLLAVDSSHVPAAVRNRLWLAVMVQVIITFGIASLRPFTQQAFGTLVPTLGIGFAALWGSRFAQFHKREDRR